MTEKFKKDVLEGLSSKKKQLSSKYFYDDTGSQIFQEIMAMPEYYLTNCEFEVLSTQGAHIGSDLKLNSPFNVIELGAGDGTKTIALLKQFEKDNLDFTYFPIDVSSEALNEVEKNITKSGCNFKYELLCGDYFEIIKNLPKDKPALFLFLGANIGNYKLPDATAFIQKINEVMMKGDHLMIGVDLQKNPLLIRSAYDDVQGITKRFNMNLLNRMNKELQANFELDNFDFYCSYNPENGEVNSYLISLKKQTVNIESLNQSFNFERYELIHTELSRKYTLDQLVAMSKETGFELHKHYLDCKHHFVDTMWIKQ